MRIAKTQTSLYMAILDNVLIRIGEYCRLRRASTWHFGTHTYPHRCMTKVPDSANGRVTDSKILCPFVSVHMRFLSVPRAVNASWSGNIRFVRSYPLTSFGHVQNIEWTPPVKDASGEGGGVGAEDFF